MLHFLRSLLDLGTPRPGAVSVAYQRTTVEWSAHYRLNLCMSKLDGTRRLDSLTVGEYEPIKEKELKALRCAALGGPALEVDRKLLARLLCEREGVMASFESARLLLEALEEQGLIPPPEDDDHAIGRYAVALKHFCELMG